MPNLPTPSHGQYLTLIKVTGTDRATVLSKIQALHDGYMAEFGDSAMTVMLLELTGGVGEGTSAAESGGWNFVLRYFGPTGSVGWLQSEMEGAAQSVGATITTATFSVSDITGRH
jgi:hypothetical protein